MSLACWVKTALKGDDSQSESGSLVRELTNETFDHFGAIQVCSWAIRSTPNLHDSRNTAA